MASALDTKEAAIGKAVSSRGSEVPPAVRSRNSMRRSRPSHATPASSWRPATSTTSRTAAFPWSTPGRRRQGDAVIGRSIASAVSTLSRARPSSGSDDVDEGRDGCAVERQDAPGKVLAEHGAECDLKRSACWRAGCGPYGLHRKTRYCNRTEATPWHCQLSPLR